MHVRGVSIGRGAGMVDPCGEECASYYCSVCASHAPMTSLIVIHTGDVQRHEVVHEVCAVQRGTPWSRCAC
jgi:hypothetical protein